MRTAAKTSVKDRLDRLQKEIKKLTVQFREIKRKSKKAVIDGNAKSDLHKANALRKKMGITH